MDSFEKILFLVASARPVIGRHLETILNLLHNSVYCFSLFLGLKHKIIIQPHKFLIKFFFLVQMLYLETFKKKSIVFENSMARNNFRRHQRIKVESLAQKRLKNHEPQILRKALNLQGYFIFTFVKLVPRSDNRVHEKTKHVYQTQPFFSDWTIFFTSVYRCDISKRYLKIKIRKYRKPYIDRKLTHLLFLY